MEENRYSEEQTQLTAVGDWSGSSMKDLSSPSDTDDDKNNAQLERAIRFAKEESLRLGHKFVGSEHLLIGILRQDKRVAAMVLNSLGVSTDKARREVKSIIGYGAGIGEISEEDLHSTHLFRQVVETSFEVARRFKCNDVRTEHLLLALIANEKGVAVRVLEILNVDLNRLQFLIHEVDK